MRLPGNHGVVPDFMFHENGGEREGNTSPRYNYTICMCSRETHLRHYEEAARPSDWNMSDGYLCPEINKTGSVVGAKCTQQLPPQNVRSQ